MKLRTRPSNSNHSEKQGYQSLTSGKPPFLLPVPPWSQVCVEESPPPTPLSCTSVIPLSPSVRFTSVASTPVFSLQAFFSSPLLSLSSPRFSLKPASHCPPHLDGVSVYGEYKRLSFNPSFSICTVTGQACDQPDHHHY